MTEATPDEPTSRIDDEALPEDLQPGDDNPLAEGLEPGETVGDLLEDGKPAAETPQDGPDGPDVSADPDASGDASRAGEASGASQP